ncbi:MAG TPA: phosphosulfolactate synthase [Candidatus Acidoferrales bacterium]|nr:phosphosulfolactate synthase [Candidatus Acidoferrales bacterium]
MQRRFLDFIELAPRSKKPRTQGISIFAEHGTVSWTKEMLEMWGEYVDVVKYTPTCLHAPWHVIEQKVKLYRDHGVGVAADDPMFAIAYYQGKADQFLRTIRDIGFTHAQIDTEHIKLGERADRKKVEEDWRRYMAMALELGLKVDGEVGQKIPEGDPARSGKGRLNIPAVVEEMKRLLAAGCEHVYLESRVIREVIGDYGEIEAGTAQIREIVEQVGQENIIIEISGQLPFDTRMCHRFWAVRTFGPEVNMSGGGSIEEARYVEAIRRGNTFVNGPSRASSKLWIKSLAKNGGKAADEWWKEEYPIDPAVVAGRSLH